jgi:hypothetical protein
MQFLRLLEEEYYCKEQLSNSFPVAQLTGKYMTFKMSGNSI